ncbi:MAG: hypothetical protein AB9917_01375 [Negativicutes bacterium]
MKVKRLIGLRFLIHALLMCMSFHTVAAAAGITLKAPNNSTPLELGKEVPIVWTYSGLPDTATVKVSLLKNGVEIGDIAKSVPIKFGLSPSGTGALPGKWKTGSLIGGSVAEGTGYKIRVRVNGNSAQDESDSAFPIVGAGQAASLKLLTPKDDEKMELGKPIKITWTSNGVNGQLLVKLYKENQEKGTIARPDAAAGFFDWTAGKLLPPFDQLYLSGGIDYSIHISAVNGTLTDQRNITLFHPFGVGNQQLKPPQVTSKIVDSFGEKWIKVTGPAAGTQVNRFGELDLTYEYSPNLKGKRMKIVLYKEGTKPNSQSYAIIDNWPINSGAYHSNLPGPESLELGSYRIRLQCLEYPGVYGDSQSIIVAPKERFVTRVFSAKIVNHEKMTKQSNDHVQVVYDTDTWSQKWPDNVRVGYRYVKYEKAGTWSLYRSYIGFDLKNIAGKVKWAKLSYVKDDGTPEAPRPIFALTMPWNGSASDLFTYTGNPVNALNAEEMRKLVQGWLDDPQLNFGLVMRGPKEWQEENKNQGHIMVLYNVRLEVGLTILE